MCIYGILRDDVRFYCFQRKETNGSKVKQAIVNMPLPKNLKQIQIFNGMTQFYRCYIKKNCCY